MCSQLLLVQIARETICILLHLGFTMSVKTLAGSVLLGIYQASALESVPESVAETNEEQSDEVTNEVEGNAVERRDMQTIQRTLPTLAGRGIEASNRQVLMVPCLSAISCPEPAYGWRSECGRPWLYRALYSCRCGKWYTCRWCMYAHVRICRAGIYSLGKETPEFFCQSVDHVSKGALRVVPVVGASDFYLC